MSRQCNIFVFNNTQVPHVCIQSMYLFYTLCLATWTHNILCIIIIDKTQHNYSPEWAKYYLISFKNNEILENVAILTIFTIYSQQLTKFLSYVVSRYLNNIYVDACVQEHRWKYYTRSRRS